MRRGAFASLAMAVVLGSCQGSVVEKPLPAQPGNARSGYLQPSSSLSKNDLLYVSNGDGEVTVYLYWRHKLVATLTNFTQPMGMCVDGSGDVFISDFAAKRVAEYAHGATKAMKQLDLAPYEPYACSVDPSTGDLAVADEGGGSSNAGNIAIYRNASGSPTFFADATLGSFRGCAYDDKGNLLVTNGTPNMLASFAWLPKNGTKLIDINLPGPQSGWQWRDVFGIQWDGRYFAIDDTDIYQIALFNGQAYYVGMTELGYIGQSGPYWIYNNKPGSGSQGTQVVGGFNTLGGQSAIEFWKYPAGGEDIGDLAHGIYHPFGVAVSLKKSR